MRAQEKRELVRRLQAGKRKAKRERPKRLRQVEARLDELERRRRELPAGERSEIYRELRDLGAERLRLKWGD